MGRTTYFSLPRHPLPGRKNIVLNLGGDPIPEAECVLSFDEAFAAAEPADKCFVMGGASVYRAAIDLVDTMYITHVHTIVKEADVFFPQIDPLKWERVSLSPTSKDPETGFEFEFAIYRRRR